MTSVPESITKPNLGGQQRGALSDWITQRWVQLTGKSVNLSDYPWLEGPVGDVELIGSAFFRRLAERKNLDFVADGPGRGLIHDFSRLSGPACSPNDVDARVVAFYENTAEFEFDIWSEWCGGFRPFGGALAAIFSRRLQQLNVPLSPLDTKLGITSDVVQLKERSGQVVYTAWVRDVVSTKRTLYAGSYSVCHVPGYPGPCVKVVFPLPNGSAMVIMRPESGLDGSFTVRSRLLLFRRKGARPGMGTSRAHAPGSHSRVRRCPGHAARRPRPLDLGNAVSAPSLQDAKACCGITAAGAAWLRRPLSDRSLGYAEDVNEAPFHGSVPRRSGRRGQCAWWRATGGRG